ncbi:MAG: hypothetical protein BV456_12080 [Thermoplasmata archaeon M8B2D]|nr:MAG: hypothetical protein BV456_12080 [Thermoplasmata archaeon M8B2D]
MSEDETFKVTVEISRKWEGNEVAKELSEKINNKISSPKFILLFTTIQYEKEFEKILNGLKTKFPNSPLIGGTVAGFMTEEGCFTRGVTSLAVDCSNIKISTGIGHETKKNPEKASIEFVKKIKDNANQFNSTEKFLFILTSGTKVPSLIGKDVKRVYKSKISSIMVSKLLKASPRISDKGLGREDKVLEIISKSLPDYKIIGGSSIDDNKLEKNYQFFNDEIFTNSVVGISIETDMNVLIDSQLAVEKTDLIFDISTDDEKCIINKIDGKPATETFFKYLKWPNYLMDERLFRRTFFYPLIFEKNGELYPEVIGGLAGNSIICGFNLESDRLFVGQSSSKILNNALNKSLNNITKMGTINFSLIIYCSALLEALGINFFKVYKMIKERHNKSPFLLIATGGEDFSIPHNKFKHSNETINFATFTK